ncbi:MAG TPA: DUF4214 domain-containing protein [Pirellulales bacterium]|jgi:uncharacterized repeat protein (TIGR01451 family)|nr:DUF4214 domain-containing protein [Pirellulales bacterium]
MHTWLRNLPRSAQGRKRNRKNREPRLNRRPKSDALKFGLERLEDRALLSITPTGATITAVEGASVTTAVATFTSTDAGPFTAKITGWGDGTSSTGTVSGTAPNFTVTGTHTYADEVSTDASGPNLVVTISDPQSPTATVTGSANASDADTLVAASTPVTLTGTEGQTASLTATFTNTGATPSPSSDFEAVIDWGDGTSQSIVSGAAITGAATLTVHASHVYIDEPATAPFVSLNDDSPAFAGAVDTVAANITEADALTAAGTAATITATQGSVFSSTTLATFTDTYTGNTASDFTATINWGDGTSGAGVVSSTAAGTLSVSGSHVYTATGAHLATVTLADDASGTATGTATATVNVSAAPSTAPSVSVANAGPSTAFAGATVTYTITLANSSNANAATNVALVDQLGPGEAFFSASDTAGTKLTFNSTTGQLTGTVANIGTSASDTVTIIAVATGTGNITNNASISIPLGNTGTPISASATTTVTSGASPANVTVDIGEPLGTLYAGDVMEYDSAVLNQGNTAASNVSFAFQLDPNQVLLSVSDQDNTSFSLVNGVITGTIASVPGIHSDRITILLGPTPAAAIAGSVTNSVIIAAPAGINSGVITDAATETIHTPLATAPDVTVTKTGPATGVVGGPVTYTVTLANVGATAAANVQVGDPLGPNEVLLSATDTAGTSFSLTNGEVTGQVASIPAGGTDTVTIVAVPTAAGTLSNTAYTGIPGGNQASNVSSPPVTTTVSAAPANAANLTITKTGPVSANEGDLATYSVKIANSGGAATNVQFNDALSDLFIYSVSDTAGTSFSVNENLGSSAISGTIASIAAGSSDTITIVAIPISNGTATDPITVAVPAGNLGMSTATNSTTINLPPTNAANVTITKTAPATVARGEELSATVRLTNVGTASATNVAFVDSFPGQAYFTASDTRGTVFTFDPKTGLLTGTIANLGNGITDTITIVTVPPAAGTVTDQAGIGIVGGNQAFPSIAQATTTVTPIGPVPIPGVGVAKTGPTTGTAGSPISDTITLTNGAGLTVPSSVAFVDTVGFGVRNVTASDGAGDTFTYNIGQVTGTVSSGAFTGTGAGNTGGTATVTVTFTPDGAGSLTDTATIAIPGGNQGGPVTASLTTAVVTPASLFISKTGTPATISVGDTETYTITISNTGGTAATGAVVTDAVPTGLTNVHATDAAGTVTISGNTVTDHLGSVAANTGTETLTITGTAAALPSGTTSTTITNTASLAFAGLTTPSNTVSTTVNSTSPAGLSISKTGSPATVVVGGTETYTITISNTGGTAATGAVVTDTVPTGLTNVHAADAAGTVTISGNTVTDSLGTVAANTGTETLTITATAAALPSGTTTTTVTNTASLAFGGTTTPSNSVMTTINSAAPPVTTGVGFLAGQPGDGTPQTFVHNLYRELLGREPDSAGNAAWVAYLTQHNNAAGQIQVIQGFLNSPEYAIHYVTTLYEVILGRAPDAPGLQYWTSKMDSPGTPGGHTGSADEKGIVAAFFGSDEFYIKSGNTAQGWINALYEDILGRAPDGSGMTFWANELTTRGAGDRDGIVRDLLTTPEAAHLVLDSFYPAAGGTSSNPLPAPGAPAGNSSTDLAIITGDGWENLYLEGPYDSQPEGNDSFFTSLAGGGGWDDVQLLLLETSQFYTNPNRPITH